MKRKLGKVLELDLPPKTMWWLQNFELLSFIRNCTEEIPYLSIEYIAFREFKSQFIKNTAISGSISSDIKNMKNPFFEGSIYISHVQEVVNSYLITSLEDLHNIEHITSVINTFVKEGKCASLHNGWEYVNTLQILCDMLKMNITLIDATGPNEVILKCYSTPPKHDLTMSQIRKDISILKTNSGDKYYTLFQSKAQISQHYQSDVLSESPVYTTPTLFDKESICESIASMSNFVSLQIEKPRDEFMSRFESTEAYKNMKLLNQLAKFGGKCQRCKVSMKAYEICNECHLSLCDSCISVLETYTECPHCAVNLKRHSVLAIYAIKVYNQKETATILSTLKLNKHH